MYLLPPGTHSSHLKDKQHSYSLKINRGDSGDLSRLSSLPLPCTIYLVIILNYSHKNFHETMEKNHLFLYICHLVFYITTGGTYRSNRELYCEMLLKKIKRKNLFALVPEVFSITNLLLKNPNKLTLFLNDNQSSVKPVRNSKLKLASRELILFTMDTGVSYFDKHNKFVNLQASNMLLFMYYCAFTRRWQKIICL